MVRCQSYLIESITRYRPIGLEGATFILHGSHSMSRQGLYVTVRYPSVCSSVPAADRCSSVRRICCCGPGGQRYRSPSSNGAAAARSTIARRSAAQASSVTFTVFDWRNGPWQRQRAQRECGRASDGSRSFCTSVASF